MIAGITITCFTASYLLALGAEIARFGFRARVRTWLNVAFALAGLLAHTLYLWKRANEALQLNVPLFSGWYDWCLLAAWILAAAYVSLMLRHAENAVGLFLLPLILALIILAVSMGDQARFSRTEALGLWRTVHGSALLTGTVAVTLAFGAGIMYLVQSYRLKKKLPTQQGIRLPSLEWLQRFNLRSLWISTGLLAVGLISGIALNSIKSTNVIAWSDPVIISSGILFLWLLSASLFEAFYKPARQGRKVVYLTVASFIFLALAFGFVLKGEHASPVKDVSEAAGGGP